MATTAKNILFGSEAREQMMIGAEIMAHAVGITLGPKGRNVSLMSQYGGEITVHDGVTVSNEIKLSHPQQDIGATKLREAAKKTNDSSGDGTSTSTVLAYEIAKQGESYLIAGANPMILVKGIQKAVDQAVSILEGMSEDIKGDTDKMIQVASVSAADEEIGKIVAEALKKVGAYGVVTVDKGSENGYHTEYKDGMEWDQGFTVPWVMTDPVKRKAVLKDPYILVTDKTLRQPSDVVPILQLLSQDDNKTILIIADGIEQQAQAVLLQNHANVIIGNNAPGLFRSLFVGAPSLGNHKRDGLEDIAILTGATFISQELGRSLKDIQLSDLGHADEVVSTEQTTIIIGGKGDIKKVKARAKAIQTQIKEAEHEQLREKYQERLAKLTSGVAVIKVGTPSDTENREKLERVRDAIGATKAAADGGIIPGGGLAFLRVSVQMKTDYEDREESFGAEIVKKALLKPIKLLAENAGVNGDVVLSELERKTWETGYNVVTGEYVDMKKAGIVDPVRVTIAALQNAASVAAMILTTDVTITDVEEEKKQPQQ